MQHGPVRDFDIKSKIVAVTGGGSGIGFAFVKICHERGARIVIGDIKLTDEAQRFVDDVSDREVIYQHCDVSNWGDLRSLITASLDKLGDVPDVYVPCAGVYEPPWSNFWDDSEDESYRTMQINVNHPIKLTRLAIRALAGAEKQGVVCLVASTAGAWGLYIGALYAASKHAVVGFTRSVAEADLEQGVKVVCILPGLVQSPLWEDREDDMAERFGYRQRLKIALQPVEVARVMLKMVENDEFPGGACVVKTASEEHLLEGHTRNRGSSNSPPITMPDHGRIKDLLEHERGQAWKRVN